MESDILTYKGPNFPVFELENPNLFKKHQSLETLCINFPEPDCPSNSCLKPKKKNPSSSSTSPPIYGSDEFLIEGLKKQTINLTSDGDHYSQPRSRLYTLISKLYIVIHFIMKLKECSGLRKPKFLSDYHFDLIGDKCFYPKIYKKIVASERSILRRRESLVNLLESQQAPQNKKMKDFKNFLTLIKLKMSEFTYKIVQLLPVIDPTHPKTIVIDVSHILLIVFYFIAIPIELAFDVEIFTEFQKSNPYSYTIFLKLIPLILLIFYSVVDLHKAYYKRGTLVNDREKISMRYLRKYLIYDIASMLFLFLSLIFSGLEDEGNNIRYLIRLVSLLYFFKIKKFKAIMEEIEEFMYLDESSYNVFSLLSLLYRTLFILHILACVWYSLGNNDTAATTWLSVKGITDDVWWIKYLYSTYFIVITMNTVGYGDISPSNETETIFTIFLVYFACGLFAYTITCIGNILNDISRRQKVFKRQINVINGYMRKFNIPYNLRKNVRKYLEYIWSEENSQNQKEEELIINSLSESLKEKLLLEAHGYPLKAVPFFCNNFSEQVLRKTVFITKEIRFIPGEFIYMKDDYDDKSLYLIRKGEIGTFIESNNSHQPYKILCKYGKGQVIGDEEFFSDEKRKLGAVSIDYTTVLRIRLSDFENILKDFPEDKEKFHSIRTNTYFNQDFTEIEFKCSSCSKSNHTLNQCPWIHRKFLKTIILKKYLYSIPHSREPAFRRKSRYFSLKDKKFIVDGAHRLGDDMDIYSDTISIINESDEDLYFGEDDDSFHTVSEVQRRLFDFQINPNLNSPEQENENNTFNENDVENRNPTNTLERVMIEPSLSHLARMRKISTEKEKNGKSDKKEKTEISEENNLVYDQISNFTEFFPEFNIEIILEKYSNANSNRKKRRRRNSIISDLLFKPEQKEIFVHPSKKRKRNFIYEKDYFFHSVKSLGDEKKAKKMSLMRINSVIQIKSRFSIAIVPIKFKKMYESFANLFRSKIPRKESNSEIIFSTSK